MDMVFTILNIMPLEKNALIKKIICLNLKLKHMLRVLKRTISKRPFFEHPQQMLKLMGKKISTFLCSKVLFILAYRINYSIRADPGSEFVVGNTLAKSKKLEPDEINFSQG